MENRYGTKLFGTSHFTVENLQRPLDNKQILCYNKDVPRGEDIPKCPTRYRKIPLPKEKNT